jgi:hypothetical protein
MMSYISRSASNRVHLAAGVRVADVFDLALARRR